MILTELKTLSEELKNAFREIPHNELKWVTDVKLDHSYKLNYSGGTIYCNTTETYGWVLVSAKLIKNGKVIPVKTKLFSPRELITLLEVSKKELLGSLSRF